MTIRRTSVDPEASKRMKSSGNYSHRMDRLLTESLSNSADTRWSRDMGWGFRSVGAEMTVGGREVSVRDREVGRAKASGGSDLLSSHARPSTSPIFHMTVLQVL